MTGARTDKGSGGTPNPSASTSTSARPATSEPLRAVRECIEQTPEVDRKRIAEIKQSIADGRYVLDPLTIAQSFSELEGLLGGK